MKENYQTEFKLHSPVIAPDTTGWTGNNFINDATGPKDPFPLNTPWIILASDRDGRVYEADLSLFFNVQ